MAERLLETLEQLSPSEPEAGPDEELPSDEGSVAEHSDDQTR
jgi:hypothetical protein